MTSGFDLKAVGDALDANERAADKVLAGLSQAQLERQPEGGWSILQCLEHLALANSGYNGAMRKVLAGNRSPGDGTIRPSAGGRWFLEKLEPPVKQKVKAPKVIVPGSGRSSAEVLGSYRRSHDELRKTMAAAAGRDLNAIKFRNPLLPLLRVRVGTGLLIVAAHGRRHLWQAQRIRAAVLGAG